MRILLPDGAGTLNAGCARTDGGWAVTYELPFRMLRLSFPAFVPSGKSRGKFYKFGDLTEREHYFAWNRVEAEHPDFHIPAYFGELFFLIDNSAPDPGSCGPGVLSDKQGHAWLIPVPGCAIIKQRAAVNRLDKSNRLTAADR